MDGDRQHSGGGSVAIVDGVLFGADNLVERFVASMIPDYVPMPNTRALGVVKGAEIVAGVTYSNFNGKHVQASIAAKPRSGWASRRALAVLFGYPFRQLGCEAITVTIPSTNLPSINLATKLGFQPEAMIRFAAHDGSTLLILKSFRDTCKWVRLSDGQGRRKRTGGTGPVGDSGSGSLLEQA